MFILEPHDHKQVDTGTEARLLILIGMTVIFLCGLPRPAESHRRATKVAAMHAHLSSVDLDASSRWAGLICCAGALLAGVMAVMTESVLKNNLRTVLHSQQADGPVGKSRPVDMDAVPRKLITSNHQSMFTSFFAFAFLGISAAMIGEFDDFPDVEYGCFSSTTQADLGLDDLNLGY